MIDREAAARAEILGRLSSTREELRQILDPPPPEPGPDGSPGVRAGGFPRSRTLQMLMSGRGLGTVGAVVAGLVAARPALALRVLRMLPTGAVARMLLLKAFTAVRPRRQ